jgi:anti-sigma B factor antagonist
MRTPDVVLPARVDATTSSDVRYALQIAQEASPDQQVLVDASLVEVVDVAGLGVLVGAHRRCQQEGKRLVFCDPKPSIVRLFALTRLHRVLNLDREPAAVERQQPTSLVG